MARQENTPKAAPPARPGCSDSSAQPRYEPPEAPQKSGFITLLFLKLLLQPTALLIAIKYLTVTLYFPRKKAS